MTEENEIIDYGYDPTEDTIKEIELIRKNSSEDDSYLRATLEWMEINDIELDKKTILSTVPSYIIDMIKNEAFEENLVKPSTNPHLDLGNSNAFNDLFF